MPELEVMAAGSVAGGGQISSEFEKVSIWLTLDHKVQKLIWPVGSAGMISTFPGKALSGTKRTPEKTSACYLW